MREKQALLARLTGPQIDMLAFMLVQDPELSTSCFGCFETNSFVRISIANAEGVNCRERPDSRARRSRGLHTGETYLEVSQDQGWTRLVAPDGKSCWAASNYLEPAGSPVPTRDFLEVIGPAPIAPDAKENPRVGPR